MKKLNIKDIIAVIDGGDLSELRFATKDGTPVDWIETRDFKGFATDDDAADMVQADILHAMCFDRLNDIYGEDEKTWEAEANKQLADFGVKLGAYHNDTVSRAWEDGYYELEAL